MALETVGDNCLLRTAGKKPSSPKAFSKFFLEGAKLIAPSPIFGNIGHTPIEKSLWTPWAGHFHTCQMVRAASFVGVTFRTVRKF